MLRVACMACMGNGEHWSEEKSKWVECKKCNGQGYLNADENKKVYVSAYRVTREFGGHEEGGWWYNQYVLLETVPCKNKYSDEIYEELKREYEHYKHGDIYSVLGGVDIAVCIEEKRGENETKERPMYE